MWFRNRDPSSARRGSPLVRRRRGILRDMLSTRRRGPLALVVACCVVLASACTATPPVTDSGPAPDASVAAFAAAWHLLKADPIAALTSDPGSAAQGVGSVIKNLTPIALTVTPGKVQKTDDDNATSTAVFNWTLKD